MPDSSESNRSPSGSQPSRREGETQPSFSDLPVGARVSPDALFANARYTISSPEDPAQLTHNREMEKLKESHRQRLELQSWWAAVLVTLGLVGVFAAVYFHSSNAEIQKTALAGLLSIFTAWLGFIAGRASGRSRE